MRLFNNKRKTVSWVITRDIVKLQVQSKIKVKVQIKVLNLNSKLGVKLSKEQTWSNEETKEKESETRFVKNVFLYRVIGVLSFDLSLVI